MMLLRVSKRNTVTQEETTAIMSCSLKNTIQFAHNTHIRKYTITVTAHNNGAMNYSSRPGVLLCGFGFFFIWGWPCSLTCDLGAAVTSSHVTLEGTIRNKRESGTH